MKTMRLLLATTAIAWSVAGYPVESRMTGDPSSGTSVPTSNDRLRTVTISPATRWMNVRYGDVVRIVGTNDAEFTWRFDGHANALDLASIAPTGVELPHVIVYVDQTFNPLGVASSG